MAPRLGNFAVAAAVAAALLGSLPAQAAEDVAQMYKDKGLTVVVSYDVGGSYDLYGRLVARHIGRHLPGAPNAVVKNMVGAGGVTGANHLYNVAPRDGTTIGVINQNAASGQLLGTRGVAYDAGRFNWIGRLNDNAEIFFAWHASGVRSIDDAFKRQVVAGGTGPTSSSSVLPRVMNELFGTRFKTVSGYKSTGETLLALERGEADATVLPWTVIKADKDGLLRDKKANLLLQLTGERHPDLPDVATIVDVAKTQEQRDILSLFVSGSDVGRSIVAPPEMAPERVKLLRDAFAATLRDPAFMAESEKLKLPINAMAGEKLQKMIADGMKVSPAIVGKAKKVSAAK